MSWKDKPKPLMWCVMLTTARRRHCLPNAIRCWMAQDWENRELLIVDGGREDVTETVADIVGQFIALDPRIHYTRVDRVMTVGEKYNHGCGLAPPGSWISIWGDDDWIHPKRLSYVGDSMLEFDVTIGGTISMLAYRPRDKTIWLYAYPFPLEPGARDGSVARVVHPYLIGGTMIFSREDWARSPFPHLQRGSDTEFIHRLLVPDGGGESHFLPLNEPRLYVAFVHNDNTGNTLNQVEDGGPMVWSLAPEGFDHRKLRMLLGSAADAYGIDENP